MIALKIYFASLVFVLASICFGVREMIFVSRVVESTRKGFLCILEKWFMKGFLFVLILSIWKKMRDLP